MTPETRLDDAHRRRLLVARLTSAAGDPKHAEELLEQQLARSDEGHARAEVSFELGNVRLTMRGNSAARYCYENALAELGDADEHDELRLRILLELAIAHSGELRHESDVSERAIALAEKLGRPDLLARALGTHAMTPRLLGEPPDDAYWRRALRVERESGELRYGGPTHAYALHVFIQDDYETGAQHLQRLMESMRARADPKLTWVLQDLSDVARASGAWNVGSKLADEAYEYALQTGQESLEPQCLMYTARFALLRGDQGADHSSDGASPAA
jgi:hypothetical protein